MTQEKEKKKESKGTDAGKVNAYPSHDSDYEEEFTPTTGWCSTGSCEQVYCMAGEGPDHTACDNECGYCGRCSYQFLVARDLYLSDSIAVYELLSTFVTMLHQRD